MNESLLEKREKMKKCEVALIEKVNKNNNNRIYDYFYYIITRILKKL